MSSTDIYSSLREWHLARLRNLAERDKEKTTRTPASLIVSDKEAIREMVAASVSNYQAATAREKDSVDRGLLAAGVWLFVQLISLGFTIGTASDAREGILQYLKLTFGTLLPGAAGAFELDAPLYRLIYCGFFFLPPLLIALVPNKNFSWLVNFKLPDSKDESGMPVFESRLPFLFAFCAGLILFILAPWISPASDSLNSSQLAGLQVLGLLSWMCVVVVLLLLQVKLQRYNSDHAMAVVDKLEAEIHAVDSSARKRDFGSRIFSLWRSVQELVQRERAIADFSKTVIVSFNKGLEIDAASPSALTHWGYLPSELLNRNLSSLIFVEDMQSFQDNIDVPTTARSDNPIPLLINTRIRTRSNDVLDYQWHIEWSPRFNRFFASCDDISDRKRLERARADFIAQLSHDMRSPLSSVLMLLRLFSEGLIKDVPAQIYEILEQAKGGVSRVLGMIDEILEAEKLQHGQQAIQREYVQLLDLCKTVAGESQIVAQERGVALDVSGQQIVAFINEKLLSRVISNLVSNAVSVSPEKSTVKIEVAKSGASAIVRVIDSGPGIHRDYHRLIFERYQAPVQLSSKRVSTGLGLWICRDVVEAHGGMIGVESEPGKGSTFWFTLPMSTSS
jgi:signal transduction histidine kinase